MTSLCYFCCCFVEIQCRSSGKSPSVSETSSPEPVSTPSPVPPLVSPQSSDSSKVPVRPKRTSSASHVTPQFQTTVRPKTAPPAPPIKSPAGIQSEVSPPQSSSATKKPLSRLPTAFSESRIAAEKSLLMDEYQSMQYSEIAILPSTNQGNHVSSLSTPYSRLSLASVGSRQSTETYIGVGDLASTPNNMNSSIQDDVRSYLDLQPPLESEELYISSHFADEPLYQFYTASIIEV